MSEARDAGYQALQQGDVAGAVARLEEAAQQNPQDYLAHLYLGAAYGQAGRHAEAVQALTRAVQLDPSNAQARYNLGIALERAGWREQAVTALQQALQLQPDYSRAREALQSLQGGAGAPQPPAAGPRPSSGGETTLQSPGASAQPLSGYSPPSGTGATPLNAPAAGTQPLTGPQPLTGAPPSSPSSSPTIPLGGYSPPGGTPTQPLGGSSGYRLPPAYGPSGYAPGGYPGGSPYTQAAYVPDSFNPMQGFNDWWRVLVSPQKFFQEQVGREGINAPIATLVVYALISGISGVITALIMPRPGALDTPMLGGAMIIGALIGIPIVFVMALVASFILGGLVHGVGKLFGNSAPYAGSFRAVTYSAAPYYLMTLIASLLSPLTATSTAAYLAPNPPARILHVQFQPGAGGESAPPSFPTAPPAPRTFNFAQQSNPIGMIVRVIGGIWSIILLGIGIRHIQRISNAGAVVTTLIAVVLPVILVVGAMVAAAAAFVAAMKGLPGQPHFL